MIIVSAVVEAQKELGEVAWTLVYKEPITSFIAILILSDICNCHHIKCSGRNHLMSNAV